MNHSPKVSIVTIVFNGEKEIESTIQSVCSQTYSNIEYIIIDGASRDNTLSVVNKYKNRIAKIISEPDNGLYDAMNKGLANASGDYIWFMNAGDQIHDADVLSKIFSSLTSLPDVIYGETDMVDESGNIIGERRLKAPESLNWKSLQWGMVVCHQSFIAKRSLAAQYNLQYKIAADIDWMIATLKNAHSVHNAGIILSKFKTGGKSYKNIPKGLRERFNIMTKNYGFIKTLTNHFVLGIKFIIYVIRHRRF